MVHRGVCSISTECAVNNLQGIFIKGLILSFKLQYLTNFVTDISHVSLQCNVSVEFSLSYANSITEYTKNFAPGRPSMESSQRSSNFKFSDNFKGAAGMEREEREDYSLGNGRNMGEEMVDGEGVLVSVMDAKCPWSKPSDKSRIGLQYLRNDNSSVTRCAELISQ